MIILWWLTAILSVIGSVLNVRKNRLCFIFWLISNALWIIENIITHSYYQLPMWITYMAISIWGIIAWRKNANNNMQ
jgi:nicotinamide riboside transporter PnuC